MTPLVTSARYTIITGDTTSAVTAVTGALIDAQAMLEEDLGGRPLTSEERTEQLYPDSTGRLYPTVTPITAVSDGYTIDGSSMFGSAFLGVGDFINPAGSIEVTYTAGYVERTANPTASNRLPEHVERDLAWCAYRLLHPSGLSTAIPKSATSVRLGDAALGFASGSTPQGSDTETGWSKATMRLRRRRI